MQSDRKMPANGEILDIASYLLLDGYQRTTLSEAVAPHRVHYSDEADEQRLMQCQLVFGNPPPSRLPLMRQLSWVQLGSTGFGEYAAIEWPDSVPLFSRLEGFYADPVAESCLAGILSLLRGVNRCVELQSRREWVGHSLRPDLGLLSDRDVVLFGYGAINRRLAELLAAFRCRVSSFGSDWTPASMDPCLRAADVVVTVAPGTPESDNVFDAGRLALLHSSAIFVNAGRGSVVDEAALDNMLRQGKLAGAAIDVTVEEPLPEGHPFWDCPNLILTQHSAGGHADEADRQVAFVLANFRRYLEGAELVGVADIRRGY